jgi:hypothetical protein
VACGVLLSDTCWGGVVGLSAIEFKAHITAGTFDVGVTSKAPTQGEPFIREARTHPFNSTQEQRGVYTMTQEDSVRRLAEIREGLQRGDNCFPLSDVAILVEAIDSLTAERDRFKDYADRLRRALSGLGGNGDNT